jgi:hypothetical protein
MVGEMVRGKEPEYTFKASQPETSALGSGYIGGNGPRHLDP